MPNTITNNTKIPLYLVVSTVSLAIYGTVLYEKLSYKIDQSLSIQQAQQWVDIAREVNRVSFPALVWPAIPAKQTAPSYAQLVP